MTHAWCSDPSRDAAVRAAEDNRTGPLPTLAEAIACPFAGAAERSVPVSKPCEGQSGLRTERVTLQIAHWGEYSAARWDFAYCLRPLYPLDSVRLVEEAHFDDLAQVAMERDAAKALAETRKDTIKHQTERLAFWTSQCELRESALKKAEARVAHLEDANRALMDAANTASDMVEELKAERDAAIREREELREQLESVACRAATAETALEAAQAASVGGDHFADASKMVQPPRGWLTEEEREALDAARDYFDDDDDGDSECVFIARVLKQLLARSTPPEVVLPEMVIAYDDMDMLKEALAAAGVTVKEVGK